ncbi:MAG: ABC transporter substrate-binding protein [Rubripirellula sp.]
MMKAPRYVKENLMKPIYRCSVLGFATAVLLTGCSQQQDRLTSVDSNGSDAAKSKTQAVVQLNWYPEAEHGGVYQAAADGTYADANLDITIQPGGRATPVAPELELGRVQFAFANADDVIVYRREGLDVVAVLAAMQNSPRCILVREESGKTSLSELSGLTLQRQTGRPFLQFMRSQGVLEGVKEVPYHGSVSSLVADPDIAIQAYSFAEPLLAQQQGVKVRVLMVSDLGWNPYSSVLVTTGKLIKQNPKLVEEVVRATQVGWQNYLSDPALGNAAILKANEHGMTAEVLDFGSRELTSLALPDDLSPVQVGQMSLERWTTLVEQMESIEPKSAGKVKPAECFTTEFLNGNSD